ncbi:hypothetical protein L249_2406 [Ophiocordyceps polyrhachis-furcata BCC 54312]|uniref:BHLH domain-containing protein n=1 Tax=Ophiocordyceps polyrhachis-furcata BCC 54312 TaxID=1330021 RepID=A0A367LSD6_9HYPO|nr:hypothetical protein L249_2406 [Ophiocordyceps polyrhachis-furcata BCC 54312]
MAPLPSEASGPSPLLPFGYGIEPPSHDSTCTAPVPAPGTPILSETDNQTLHDFFECLSSNQCNDFSLGEGLNASDAWADLPPSLMGTATSFGSQPVAPIRCTHQYNHQYIFSSPPYYQQPRVCHFDHHLVSPTLLPQYHQTSTLSQSHQTPALPLPLQTSTFSHPHHTPDLAHPLQSPTVSHPNQSSYQLYRHSSQDVPSATAAWPQPMPPTPAPQNPLNTQLPFRVSGQLPGQMRHQNIEEFRADTRRSSNAANHSPTMADWMAGPGSMPSLRKPAAIFDDIKWGSDNTFKPAQNYAPEPPHDPTEVTNLDSLQSMFLDIDYSASNTPCNSPVDEGSALVKTEERPQEPSRKKRKSSNGKVVLHQHVDQADDGNDDDDDDKDNDDNGIPRRRRRSRTEGTGTSSSIDAPAAPTKKSRQRKQATNGAAAKAPRENLTDEQKRENHIKSEQKRRTVIRDGFDSLNKLVPSLRVGTFSKSTTLSVAAQWLDEFVGGNDQLTAQLEKLDPEKARSISAKAEEKHNRRVDSKEATVRDG